MRATSKSRNLAVTQETKYDTPSSEARRGTDSIRQLFCCYPGLARQILKQHQTLLRNQQQRQTSPCLNLPQVAPCRASQVLGVATEHRHRELLRSPSSPRHSRCRSGSRRCRSGHRRSMPDLCHHLQLDCSTVLNGLPNRCRGRFRLDHLSGDLVQVRANRSSVLTALWSPRCPRITSLRAPIYSSGVSGSCLPTGATGSRSRVVPAASPGPVRCYPSHCPRSGFLRRVIMLVLSITSCLRVVATAE